MPETTPLHPLDKKSNGRIAVYNLFLREYSTIDDQIRDMPRIARMNFNVVWFGPDHEPGSTIVTRADRHTGVPGFKVRGSYYAASHPDSLNGRLLGDKAPEDPAIKQIELNKKIKELTHSCTESGMVPIFDLVLNHVAADSELCQRYPHWFKVVDPKYNDACVFNYDDESVRREIIETLWRPYLVKKIKEQGFRGARIDLAWNIHPALRRELYKIIHTLVREYHGVKAIILDEWLGDYSEKRIADMSMDPAIAPTHIMTSSYWARPDNWLWLYREMVEKCKLISPEGGTVNFSGNHDHHSLGGNVLEGLAYEKLKQHERLFSLYKEQSDEDYKRMIRFSFVKEIQREIKEKPEIRREFERRCLENMAFAAFTSTAGWYALCGDEFADPQPKSVFQHADSKTDFYPRQTHKALKDEKKVETILNEIAKEELFSDSHSKSLYERLDDENDKQCLLVPFKESVCLQINARIEPVTTRFQEKLKSQGIADCEYESNPFKGSENQWGTQHNFTSFVTRVNAILQKLKRSKPGLPTIVFIKNCLVFKISCLDGSTEAVIINTDLKETMTLNQEMLKRAGIEDPLIKKYCGLGIIKSYELRNDESIELPETLSQTLFTPVPLASTPTAPTTSLMSTPSCS